MSNLIKGKKNSQGWLLFFYSVPARPVGSRMRIWRRLSKAGAVQLKGAVYILPMNEEHYEVFQWLVSEVTSLGGDAAFVRVGAIESMKDREIIAIFDKRKSEEYQALGRLLDDSETKINSFKKGSDARDIRNLSEQISKIDRSFREAGRTDFFSSKTGALLRSRIDSLNTAIGELTGSSAPRRQASIHPRNISDYQGKTWVSRNRPFVDRMASAWLIRRFIDSRAAFRLTDEKRLQAEGKAVVTFDVTGGDFTHTGELCTFETLVRAFGLKNRTLRKIAEIVHELDIKDDKYRTAEAAGIEQVLSGLRKSVKDDMELLEKGMSVFEMLYISKA